MNAWRDIAREWRNLGIKTYGGNIVRRWYKEYQMSDYKTRLKELFTKKQKN